MRTAVWVRGNDRSGEELMEEIISIVPLGSKFHLDETTIEDLRANDWYEDDSDEELSETKKHYITIVKG
jgi:hypothetical protein